RFVVLSRFCTLSRLHSFPTRRSSDLAGLAAGGMAFDGLALAGGARVLQVLLEHPGHGVGVLLVHRLLALGAGDGHRLAVAIDHLDRKSTRLNSSHVSISYAVFCLKKK